MAWKHSYKCIQCSNSYSVIFESYNVGPMDHGQIIGLKEPGGEGVSLLPTKPLYDGEIKHVKCPECHYSWHFCTDLQKHAFCYYAQATLALAPESKVDQLLSETQFEIKPFPFDCPMCSATIANFNQRTHCKSCKSEASLNLISSECA